MKATLIETENIDGKRIWIVALPAGSRDFKTKREARQVKHQIDAAVALLKSKKS